MCLVFEEMNIIGSCVYGWLPMKSFHLKYDCQLIQTTVPTTARNELQNHEAVNHICYSTVSAPNLRASQPQIHELWSHLNDSVRFH
jgi:hypothetical protein